MKAKVPLITSTGNSYYYEDKVESIQNKLNILSEGSNLNFKFSILVQKS